MSDFLKKLKSIFIAEDPNAGKAAGNAQSTKPANPSPRTPTPSVPARPTNNPTHSSPPVPPAGSFPPVTPGKANDRFTDVLLTAMYQANQDGFDYIEFKQALESLAKMPMDEATRFRSAYAMGQTMGTSFDRLINTATLYMDVLKNEQVKFEQAVANQRAQQVGNKQAEVANLEETIHQKSEQIKQLNQEIQQHQQQTERLKTEMEQAVAKVEQTHQEFAASYQTIIGQIQQDVANIKNYLK
jgi:hypothetical protein